MSVEAVRIGNAPIVSQTKHILGKVEKGAIDIEKIIKLTKKAVGFLGKICRVSSRVVMTLSGAQCMSILTGGFVFSDCISKVKELCTTKSKEKRIKAGIDVVEKGEKLTSTACSLAKNFQAIGLLSKAAIKWVGMTSFCLTPINIFFKIVKVWKLSSTISKIKEIEKKTNFFFRKEERSDAEEYEELKKIVSLVKKQEKNMDIKGAELDQLTQLVAKIDGKSNEDQEKASIDEKRKIFVCKSKDLLNGLKGKIKKIQTVNCLELATKISMLVLSIAFFILPYSPLILLAFELLFASVDTGLHFYKKGFC